MILVYEEEGQTKERRLDRVNDHKNVKCLSYKIPEKAQEKDEIRDSKRPAQSPETVAVNLRGGPITNRLREEEERIEQLTH